MKKILLLAVIGILLSSAAFAAPAATSATATPDPAANPILANIQKMGAKLYYMGNRDGLDSWFVVKNEQVQIAYATPDNKGAVVGAMFGQDGENVTVLQVSTLIQTNPEVAALIEKIKKEQAALTPVGSPPAADATTPSAPNGMAMASLSPGERLIHDLGNAATVVVGNPSSPEILMVMDPHCPHCQATWKLLHDAVIKGSLHLRMIPIGAKDSDNERAAAILLTAADPLNTWDKYVAGDKSQLVGTPTPAALDAVRANHVVIDNWNIHDTPYLVYRAKDGKVKVILGEPDKVTLLLSDLGL